jgi:L-rhamnose mutarotase
MTQQCLLLDLIDDAELIETYRQWHRPGGIPPAVAAAIRAAGIEEMELFHRDDRLVMIIRTTPDFDPQAKAASDAANPAVVSWETLMSRFQKPLRSAGPGEKWLPAERIFALSEQP